jgi:hypothetical protein
MGRYVKADTFTMRQDVYLDPHTATHLRASIKLVEKDGGYIAQANGGICLRSGATGGTVRIIVQGPGGTDTGSVDLEPDSQAVIPFYGNQVISKTKKTLTYDVAVSAGAAPISILANGASGGHCTMLVVTAYPENPSL